MRAFTSASRCFGQNCTRSVTCSQQLGQRCQLYSSSQPQRAQHHKPVRAAPEDAAEQPAAAAPAPEQQQVNPAQQQQQGSRVGDLANTIGSQKAFVSEDEWRDMDKKVNKYPCQRVFNAIGTGGDDFKAKMMQAVESVVGTIHVECVSERPSSGGKYVSVRIGPVWVENADQVVAVFNNMRKDERLKWYM